MAIGSEQAAFMDSRPTLAAKATPGRAMLQQSSTTELGEVVVASQKGMVSKEARDLVKLLLTLD